MSVQVPKGYKQTEVGVIPEDWSVAKIQDLLESKALTGHLDGNHGALYPRSHEFKSYGIPYISANNLNGVKVDFDNCKFLSVERAAIFKKGIARNFDVLFAHNATVGPAALLETSLEYVILSTTVTYFRCNFDKIISKYFLYTLQADYFVRQYQSVMSQSTRNQVPITAQRKFLVCLPNLIAEQQAIAEALSDADALIESLEQLIAKKRQIKQGAMQELLTGQRRLPGFSGEWRKETIKNIVQTPVTDGPHMTPHFLNDGIPFLSVNNLVDGLIDFGDLRYISQADHEEFSRKCKPQKGDILLGKAASVGKVAIVETDAEFNIWSPIALIRLNNKNHGKYIYYQLQSDEVNKQISLLTNTSSQGNIGMGDIEKIVIPIPDKDEQIAIAEILTTLDAEIAELKIRVSKALKIKQAMMQELLTGRIRLI